MNDLSSPSSALDFKALAQLRGEAARDPEKAIRKTAEQFESFFLQQMMKEMRATVEKSEMTDSQAMDTYQDLMDKEVALQMVRRGGIGLADMLEKQLIRQQSAAVSTQEALRLRPVGTTTPALPLHPQATPLRLPATTAPALPLGRSDAVRAYELPKTGGRP